MTPFVQNIFRAEHFPCCTLSVHSLFLRLKLHEHFLRHKKTRSMAGL